MADLAPEERRYRAKPARRYVMKLADMAVSHDAAEEAGEAELAAVETPPAQYPYGLCLALSEDELQKLEVEDGELEVGDLLDLRALAKVTSVSKSDVEGGGARCRIELQITHMALENETTEEPGGMA